jgi:hypothetical protein
VGVGLGTGVTAGVGVGDSVGVGVAAAGGCAPPLPSLPPQAAITSDVNAASAAQRPRERGLGPRCLTLLGMVLAP